MTYSYICKSTYKGKTVDNEKYICHTCVDDDFVSAFIKSNSTGNHRCSYCKNRRKSVTLYELSETIHKIINEHYIRRYDADLYPGHNIGSPAEDIISELIGVDYDLSEEIHNLLKENHNDWYNDVNLYDDDICYKRDQTLTHSLESKWEAVKLSLQCEARFFNKNVKDFFDKIFCDLNTHKTHNGENAVIKIDESTPLFRARVFDNLNKVEDALKHPEKNFGPPPYEHATSGRMNANGIPVFYGSTSPTIAIAEVRPAVGSYVVVAQFRSVKTLRILDISALDKLTSYDGSLFDPVTVEKMAISSFLRRLSRKLTIPISGVRTDHEYLITQAVSEYLSVSETYALDGIRFRTTQQPQDTGLDANDYNIVLFSKSSSVYNATNPYIKYRVELFEHDYFEYDCISWLEPSIREIQHENKEFFMQPAYETKNEHYLKLIPDSLVIHHINGVIYQSDDYDVALGSPIVSKNK
ncbi:RES family NAD+ phosphorylase [Aeromonas media]|uniref:RES family NAD+ phosphorylase n=1 Tax=Aeromonas media TaxID=651 RepID=UPI00387354F8